jgi:hypothetical protein
MVDDAGSKSRKNFGLGTPGPFLMANEARLLPALVFIHLQTALFFQITHMRDPGPGGGQTPQLTPFVKHFLRFTPPKNSGSRK